MFTIDYAHGVVADLKRVRAHERARILDAIEQQLQHQPTVETRNRKLLEGLVPPWEEVLPVWELRIGEFRVFYDVEDESETVTVRAIRHKPPDKTTEDIL